MQRIYLISNWFFGLDIIFELAFAIIALTVSMYSFKAYKLTKQNQLKLFAYSFLFISIAYILQSLTNFAIISKLNENICTILKIQAVESLNSLGIYAHMLFFIIGLVTLTYITLQQNNKKTYSLILVISLSAIFLSINKLYSFYLISSILLIFIIIHYFTNYLQKRKTKTFLSLIAFIFILFGSIHFMFSVNHTIFYIIGHFLELFAYLLILTSLILVLKNGKKKKQT